MSWSIILVIIILVLLFTFFTGFSIIFIWKKLLRRDDYLLKTRFNYLKNNIIGANIKSIQNLVNNNSNLQPILDYLEARNKNYVQQLEVLKKQLIQNSNLLKTYSLLSIHRAISQEKRNIEMLQEEHDAFKKYTLNTEEYTNYVSKLSVDLFSLISDIEGFFKETTLNLSFSELKSRTQLISEIEKITKNINIQLNFINSSDIHNLFVKQIVKTKDLFKLYCELFDIEKYAIACRGLNDIITSVISSPSIDIANINEIENYLNKSKKSLDNLKHDVQKQGFSATRRELVSKLQNLEKLNQKVELERAYKNLFEKHFYSFKENVNNFYKVLKDNSIKNAYESILDNFKQDKEICELTEENINLTNNICYKISLLEKSLDKDKLDLDYAANVKIIYEICEMIIKFKNDNENLYKKTHKKYDDFLRLSLKLSDLDLKLFHISKLVKKQKLENDEIIKNANENRQQIDAITKDFIKNYSSQSSSIESRIKSIEEFINISMDLIRRELVLKELYKMIRMYANRYYTNERKTTLATIDQYYENNNYDAAIRGCIEFVNKYKKMKKVA